MFVLLLLVILFLCLDRLTFITKGGVPCSRGLLAWEECAGYYVLLVCEWKLSFV